MAGESWEVQLRRGVGRARALTEQGFRDVKSALTAGLGEVASRGRSSTSKRPVGSKGATEEAAANPEEFFNEAQRKAVEELGLVNILISGQTGVGKSTLINAVLRAPLAQEGIGKPVTQHVVRYRRPGMPVTIFDTPGIELGQEMKAVIQEYKKTIRESRTGKAEDRIHVAWYCIDAGQARVQDYDFAIIRALAEELEVILVLTQCIDEERAQALEQTLTAAELPVHGKPIQTLARPRVLGDRKLPSHGLEELVERTNDILPEAVKRAFTNAQGVVISLKSKNARAVVVAASAAAAGVGAAPIPAPDAAVLLPLQLGMLAGINAVFGVELPQQSAANLLHGLVGGGSTALVGRQMAQTLLKFVPVAAPINAAVAAALTAALGEAYIQLCAEMLRRQDVGEPMPDAEMLSFLLNAYQTLFREKNPFRRSATQVAPAQN